MRGFMSFISGAVLGGIVGTTLGFLYAPSSGDELRAQIEARIERIQYETQRASENRRAELEHELAVLRAPRQPQT